MKHARLINGRGTTNICADCRAIGTTGYQLIGKNETKYLCRECYSSAKRGYPLKGGALTELLPAELVFSDSYTPEYTPAVAEEPVYPARGAYVPTVSSELDDYVGELVEDGHGGWRIPTEEEKRALRDEGRTSGQSDSSVASAGATAGNESVIEVKYRFTTDNRLQVILPARARIDGTTYELVVSRDGDAV